MENIANITIETERLLLVPTTQEHAHEIFKEFTDEITKYMFPNSPKEISETEARIDDVIKRRAAGEELQMTILDKHTKEFLGSAGLHGIKEAIPELWIRVKKSAHGKKIGREAVTALEARAQKNLNFQYIEYPVDKDNIGSRKIAESLGGVVEKDDQGNEKVDIAPTFDKVRTINEVMYKIPKKMVLPDWLHINKNISDTDYAYIVSIIWQTELSHYLIEKEQFYAIKDDEGNIIAFGRLYEIGPNQWELSSVRVDESQRGKKLWLILCQMLIQEKWSDKEIYLATKTSLETYYQKIWFHVVTENIPEKLIYTGKRAIENNIEFVIMKLGK